MGRGGLWAGSGCPKVDIWKEVEDDGEVIEELFTLEGRRPLRPVKLPKRTILKNNFFLN